MEINDISKILEHIKQLYTEKEALAVALAESKHQVEWKWHSDEINELAAALAKAQSEMLVAGKSKTNPYFKSKYADFEAVVIATRPFLSKNGISMAVDIICENDGTTYLMCSMLHSSGQWKKSRMRYLPPKNDIQAIASYNTSAKRLLYSNSVGVAVGDEDDDGEIAVADTRLGAQKATALNANYNPRELAPQTITKEQLEELEYEIAEFPDIAEMITEGFKINSLADMPKHKFLSSITKVREIKDLRKGIKK